MSYKLYVEESRAPSVRISRSESRASGLIMGRLEIGTSGIESSQSIMKLVEESGCDLVVIRAAADDAEFASGLHSDGYISWQADTLMYFEKDLGFEPFNEAMCDVESMEPGQSTQLDQLIFEIFESYRNHYSATPALSKIDVVRAYQHWTQSVVGNPGYRVYTARADKGVLGGICVLDSTEPTYDEILLAGVVPSNRRKGLYSRMLASICSLSRLNGSPKIVISTQACNIAAMRTWCRLGFLPTMTLNTFHVVRRAIA